MADLLAAASLLLTVVTILYSLWYSEIQQALETPIKDLGANRRSDHEKCRRVFLWKALPLALAATALLVINLPDAIELATHAASQVFVEPRLRAAYSAVNASFLGVIVVLGLLFTHTVTTCVGLARHVRKLNPTRGNY